MRLLFIEDEPDSVEPVMRWLTRAGNNCDVTGFSKVETAIDNFVPDIVILDLLERGSTADSGETGLKTYDLIWNTRFCPIVVYSAQPDILTGSRKGHPFVKSVQKGRDSNAQLKAVIGELKPHVDALRGAELLIRREFARVLRDVAPYAFEVFTAPDERNEVIVRSGRRRLAALMDDLSRHGQKLASWEQYLCPPVSDDLQLGDVLFKTGCSQDDPSSFRIVLTPSCDLVASGGRQPKVRDVLVARCCAMKEGIALTSLGNVSPGKLKDRLPSTVLSQGYFETILPLPALAGRMPHMAANLRELEFIKFGDIQPAGGVFERLASVDSPFRELVAWAYMQVACRPGIPVRDVQKWCDEIIAAGQEGGGKERA